MKGQASIEYLILSAVGLGLISLSLFSLSGIKSAMDRNLEISRFHDSSMMLHGAILGVCSSGSGNEREVDLSVPLSVRSEEFENGWVVGYSGPNISRADFSPCQVSGDGPLESAALVSNEEGKVRVR